MSTTIPTANGDTLSPSDNIGALCAGEAVTTCCGAHVTFHDATLCCKSCWRAI